jgi:hypothetical protein
MLIQKQYCEGGLVETKIPFPGMLKLKVTSLRETALIFKISLSSASRNSFHDKIGFNSIDRMKQLGGKVDKLMLKRSY